MDRQTYLSNKNFPLQLTFKLESVAVSLSMGRIFSLEYTIYRRSAVLVLLVLQHGQRVRAIQLKQFTRPSLAIARAYIEESHHLISLNHSRLVKVMIFLWKYQARYVSDDSQAIWTVAGLVRLCFYNSGV